MMTFICCAHCHFMSTRRHNSWFCLCEMLQQWAPCITAVRIMFHIAWNGRHVKGFYFYTRKHNVYRRIFWCTYACARGHFNIARSFIRFNKNEKQGHSDTIHQNLIGTFLGTFPRLVRLSSLSCTRKRTWLHLI